MSDEIALSQVKPESPKRGRPKMAKEQGDSIKKYRIKEGAPDHYFPAYGVVKAGTIVEYDGRPGIWLEEVE